MTPTESFVSHLIELRNRLLRVVIGILVVFIGLFPFANKVYALLAAPMLDKLPEGTQMIATAVVTPFFVPMKVAMMAAFVISLPHTVYQIWMFVAPGLYSHEKKLMLPTIMVSSFLFLCGMAFAYFLVFPIVFSFIIVLLNKNNYYEKIFTFYYCYYF